MCLFLYGEDRHAYTDCRIITGFGSKFEMLIKFSFY